MKRCKDCAKESSCAGSRKGPHTYCFQAKRGHCQHMDAGDPDGGLCPFDDEFWENGWAREDATDSCPVGKYQPHDRIAEDGHRILHDVCIYLGD